MYIHYNTKLFKSNNRIDKSIKKILGNSIFNSNIFKDKRTKNSLVAVDNKNVFWHPGSIKETDANRKTINRGVGHFEVMPIKGNAVRLRTEYRGKDPKVVRLSSVSNKEEFNFMLHDKDKYNDFLTGVKEIQKRDKLDNEVPVEVWESTFENPKVGVVGDFIGKDRKKFSMQKQQNYFTQMQGQNFMGMNAPLKSQDRDKIMFLEHRDSDLDLDKFNKQYWKEIMQEKPISKEMPDDFLVKPKKEEKEIVIQNKIVFPNTVSAKNIPRQYKDDSIVVTIPERFRKPRKIKEYEFVPETEEQIFNNERAWRCNICGEVDYNKTRPNLSKQKGHKCNWQLIESDDSEDRIYNADGKNVIYLDKKAGGKYPSPQFLHKVYKKIPDDKTVPVVLQTPKQYLKEYISNQEKKRGIEFTPEEKQQYINEELPKLKQVSSRFTTYHNKYMEPRVVIFPQKKVDKERTEDDILHEYGHELWEKNKNLRKKWNNRINKKYSPTMYGTTDKEEDMAESYVLYKKGKISKVQLNPDFNSGEKEKRLSLFNKVLTKDTGKNREVTEEVDKKYKGQVNEDLIKTLERWRDTGKLVNLHHLDRLYEMRDGVPSENSKLHQKAYEKYVQEGMDEHKADIQAYHDVYGIWKDGIGLIKPNHDASKNRTVLSRLADEHSSYRADSKNYQHDNTQLPYGSSQSLNLKMKKALSNYNNQIYNKETDKINEENKTAGMEMFNSIENTNTKDRLNKLMKERLEKIPVPLKMFTPDNHYEKAGAMAYRTFENSIKRYPTLMTEIEKANPDEIIITQNMKPTKEFPINAGLTSDKSIIINYKRRPIYRSTAGRNLFHELQHVNQHNENKFPFSKQDYFIDEDKIHIDDEKWISNPSELDAVTFENSNVSKVKRGDYFANKIKENPLEYYNVLHGNISDEATKEKWKQYIENQKQITEENKTAGMEMFNNIENDSSKNMAFMYPTDAELRMSGQKKLNVPVSLLYKMRGMYNLKDSETKFPDYKRKDEIHEKLINENKKKYELTDEQKEKYFEDWRFKLEHGLLKEDEDIYPKVPYYYPKEREIAQRYIEETKPVIEQETGFKVGKPKVLYNKSKRFDGVTFQYKLTKEQIQQHIDKQMEPVHSRNGGGFTRNEEEKKVYIDKLSEAIKSPEPLVPPLSIEDYEVRGGYMGEGRHRIDSTIKGGIKEVDIIVPENVVYEKGKLKFVEEDSSKNMVLKVNLHDKYFLPSKKERNIEDDPIRKSLISEGFNIEKTMVHGTSKENAEKIKQQMDLKCGTFVYPGRGGFEDASVWAKNSFTDPRVVVVETPEKLRDNFLTPWVTIGEGREERKGFDNVIEHNVPINKIKILKINGNNLEEDPTENRMPWKKFEVKDKKTNFPFTVQAKSVAQVRHFYENAGDVRDLGLWTSSDDEELNKQKTLNKYIQYEKNKEAFKNG